MKPLEIPHPPPMAIDPHVLIALTKIHQMAGVLLAEIEAWKLEATLKINDTEIKLVEQSAGQHKTSFTVTARLRYPPELIQSLLDEAFLAQDGKAYMRAGYLTLMAKIEEAMGYDCEEATDSEEDDGGFIREWGCGLDVSHTVVLSDHEQEKEQNVAKALASSQQLIMRLPELKTLFNQQSEALMR